MEETEDTVREKIITEEEKSLSRVKRTLESRKTVAYSSKDYDADLISLRNQIAEARMEDIPPLVEEMERLQEVASRRAQVVPGFVDPGSPYFGRLVLKEDERKREVLIGKSTYLDSNTGIRIVDWRDAPVSRIYYRYDEGDTYDEDFGGKEVEGEVMIRRSIAITSGNLKRIGSKQGTFVKNTKGEWRTLGGESSQLKGGQGSAMRPESHKQHRRGKLGIEHEDSIREDKHLSEITALIDPRQFELISRTDAGMVVIQGGAGSGKTTIGLHRLAYLNFQDKEKFAPENMLIIVFNDALVRYISKVLPALGVEGVPVKTYTAWVSELRQKHLTKLPKAEADDTPGVATKFKKHPVMLKMIDAYVATLSKQIGGHVSALRAKPLMDTWMESEKKAMMTRLALLLEAGKTTEHKISVERIYNEYKNKCSDVVGAWAELLTDVDAFKKNLGKEWKGDFSEEEIRLAIEWCSTRCGEVLSDLEKLSHDDIEADEDPRKHRKTSADMLGDDDSRKDSEPKESDDDDTTTGIDGQQEHQETPIDVEDNAILLRLYQKLYAPLQQSASPKGMSMRPSGAPGAKSAKGKKTKERLRYEHVLIDEAQDLSPVELAVLMGTISKTKSVTFAGDVAQRLHMDNGFVSWKQLFVDIGAPPIEIEPLRIQYRSTQEIIDLAQHVLGGLADKESGKGMRSGAPVELFRFDHSGESVAFLGEALRELMQTEPNASVAVITRYPEQADIYHQGFKNAEVPYLRRIADQDFPFKAGVDVTDVKQVKGLEFDYVVVVEASRNVYGKDEESRHLMHIAVTRAAHQCWLASVGEPSSILPQELLDRAL